MMLYKDGKFIRLDEDYDPNLKKTIEMNISNVLLMNQTRWDFKYRNTIELVEQLVDACLKSIEDYNSVKERES